MAVHTYQLIISGTIAGQFCQNIFHYKMDDAGYANALIAAQGLLNGWLADDKPADWLQFCPANYIIRSFKARRVSGGTGPEWVDLSFAGENGERSGDAQVSSTGPVIIWVIEGNFRRKGRTFVPGISITDADGGEITAAALDDFNTAADSFLGEFPADGGGTPDVTFVVAQSDNLATTFEIIDAQISKEIGVQRRRQLPV